LSTGFGLLVGMGTYVLELAILRDDGVWKEVEFAPIDDGVFEDNFFDQSRLKSAGELMSALGELRSQKEGERRMRMPAMLPACGLPGF
jgi:hypothetical protein